MTSFRFGWIDYFRKENIFVRAAQRSFGILFLHSRQIAYYLSRMVPFSPSDHVLDLGCGDGSFTNWLAYICGTTADGVDILPERIQHAQSTAKRYNLSCQYHQAAIESIPFRDNSFSRVLMIDILEHVIDPAQMIMRAASLLSPGGILFISIPRDQQNRYFQGKVPSFFNYGNDIHVREGFCEEDIVRWLRASKLINIQCKHIFFFFYQITWEMLEPIRKWHPNLYRLLTPVFYPFTMLDRITGLGMHNGLIFTAQKP